jgi:hypothetical protein
MKRMTESRLTGKLIFIFAFLLFMVISSVVALFALGPNIICMGHLFLATICAAPIAIWMFKKLERSASKPGMVESVFSAVIFLVIFGALILYTLVVERNPRNMFRAFIQNPIPAGVTNIQARDISAGFTEDVVIVFRGSPELVDEIINKRKLEPRDFRYSIGEMPDERFDGIDRNADWQFYGSTGSDIYVWLWVDPASEMIIYRQST